MSADLTRVEICHIPNKLRYSVRFGQPVCKRQEKAGKLYHYYKPNLLIGYERWHAGSHGSLSWRFMVLQTICPDTGSCIKEVPGVQPGAILLLDVTGGYKVAEALKVINQIEELGLYPSSVSSHYIRQLHQRITANQPYHPYSLRQHRAFLAEREVYDEQRS